MGFDRAFFSWKKKKKRADILTEKPEKNQKQGFYRRLRSLVYCKVVLRETELRLKPLFLESIY